MDGIPDQGHGAKTKADHQLQTREAAIEDHAPAEGGGGAEAMDVLAGMGQPLDPYGGVADRAAAGVVMGSHRRWRWQAAGGLAGGGERCPQGDGKSLGEVWRLPNLGNFDGPWPAVTALIALLAKTPKVCKPKPFRERPTGAKPQPARRAFGARNSSTRGMAARNRIASK